MIKKKKSIVVSFILLLSIFLLSACSSEDFLAEVPLTAHLEQALFRDDEADTEQRFAAEISGGNTKAVDRELTNNVEGEEKTNSVSSGNAFAYAYDRLSPKEQIWYLDILHALEAMQEEVRLSDDGLEAGLDENHIDNIFQCVLIDYPEIFYVEGYNYTKYTRGERIVGIAFSGKYPLSQEEVATRKQEIEQAVENILAGIDMQASEYDKVKYVYDTIIRNTDYDLDAPDNQNIYSVFVNRSSVCQGYAKAAQYLLNCLGVECTLVQGSVEPGEGHAWNLVRVDGSFYYVDVTWGDASYLSVDGQSESLSQTPEINYDYLCITTEQLLRTHVIDNDVLMPECTDTAANYYVRQNALFYSYDREQMTQLFQKAGENGQTDVTVKCADNDCFLEIQTALIENQEIFDYLAKEGGTITYACNDKQLSLTFWMTNQ